MTVGVGVQCAEIDLELTALCQSCGLCCDGSLFGRVRLESNEVESARRHRLLVVANGKSFEQPCTALVKRDTHHHCSIYAERPESCHRFVCKLYAGHVREPASLGDRMALVRRAKALLAFLENAGLRFGEHDEPFRDDEDSNPRIGAWMPVVRELTQILNIDFARAATRSESTENEERPTRVSRVATCRIGRPKVPLRRGSSERRSSRHSRRAPGTLAGTEWDYVAGGFGARVERIERGVGRPLAPREPPGHGGNRRGSAKHRRGSGGAALER
jgi:putative zinc- or iron-chelating protein